MKFSNRELVNRPGESSDSIQESAVEWISREDVGLTANEEAEFQAWLAADPRHAAAIEALKPTWSKINRRRHVGRGTDLRRQVEGIVARKTRRRVAVGITSLAAAAVIAFGVFLSRPAADSDRLAPTIVVRANRQLLPDGSSVDLNIGAEIALHFTSQIRGVRLVKGEALFHVTKDSARPFVVSAGTVAVRAVGTAFAVRLEPNAVDVLVTEGSVAVKRATESGQPTAEVAQRSEEQRAAGSEASSPAETASSIPGPSSSDIVVDAGKRVVVPVGATSIQSLAPQRVSSIEVATALAWRNRRVEFNGTSLAEAVEIFNRDNSVQLSVANSETGAIRITGVFWTNDPEAFSRAVQTSLGLTATRTDSGKMVLRK